jgi:hypothetical protein
VVEDDHGVAVAAGVKGLDQWVAGLKQETVVPLVDHVRDFALVDDPPLIGEFAGDADGYFVVVSVRARAFPVVMEQSMARRDPERPVTADDEFAFASVGECVIGLR